MSLQLLSEAENRLLNRREVRVVFKNASGRLSRVDAVQAVAKHLKVDQSKVFLISLDTYSGVRDVEGLFYIYHDPKEARRHLPKYIFVRMLSKDERRRKIEESKKARAEMAAAAKKK